jgi:hypothetical protein
LAGNLLKTYLKIRIHILGSGKLERAFRAFICATGDLCRPLRAEVVHGLWQLLSYIKKSNCSKGDFDDFINPNLKIFSSVFSSGGQK